MELYYSMIRPTLPHSDQTDSQDHLVPTDYVNSDQILTVKSVERSCQFPSDYVCGKCFQATMSVGKAPQKKPQYGPWTPLRVVRLNPTVSVLIVFNVISFYF